MRVPQHWLDVVQAEPEPVQPPLEQTPPEQVSEPQHCPEEVQPPPSVRQVPEPPQTPPEQVKVPQHWEEAVQRVPWPWQTPLEQTLLALHSRVPQQSAEELQTWLEVEQEPVAPSSMTGLSEDDGLQAVAASAAAARPRSRILRTKGV